MIVPPGFFIRNASARMAVTKSPEMNSPVPSMKKHRSASPSQAMPMSAFSRSTAAVTSARFSSSNGLASWFGKVPSMSMQSDVTVHGSRANNFGATAPAMPLPPSSTTLNGLMLPTSTNDNTLSMYSSAMSRDVRVPMLRTPIGVDAGGGSVPDVIMSRI